MLCKVFLRLILLPALAGLSAFVWISPARADYLADMWPNPVAPFDGSALFPNMVHAPAASFQFWEYCDCTYDVEKCPSTGDNWCEESRIVSMTIMNYGTATGGSGGDIAELYFEIVCGSAVPTQTYTMQYAGIWPVGVENFAAWTWESDPGPIVITGDPCNQCGDPTYGAYMDLFFYTDISPCPTPGASVALGPAYDVSSTLGGVYSECTAPSPSTETVPWTEKMADPAIKFIRYATKKVDRDWAPPGDTVTYTIYYGTPGVGVLNSLTLLDTVPAYMHVLTNSTTWFENINPPADLGWDPDPGPPARLRWTVNNVPTAFGRTREVMFRTTIDWGNTPIEPDSGDEGAPEGEFLFNQVHVSWDPPQVGCPPGAVSNEVSTVVKRYLFWVLGDQDVLFAPKVGVPDDEIIYDIYIKNLSDSKTWWKVKIWDTVPELIDVWAPAMGFKDPFLDWTMTPTPAAAGNPGRIVNGTDTLLTWTTDLSPGQTLSVRFKGKLSGEAKPNDKILNPAMVMALGDPGKVGGTGGALRPRGFKHEATVVLRTTFISYVGWAASDDAWFSGCVNQLYYISFYPLNKAANFQIYRKWCCAGGVPPCDPACTNFALEGGVSPRISEWVGTCVSGFAGDWEVGCGSERAPARYRPALYAVGDTSVPPLPYNYLHKLVSNSPLAWELSMCLSDWNQDVDTFMGTSSMSFRGFIAYTWLRRDVDTRDPPTEDGVHIVNSEDDTNTSIFVFQWDGAEWQFHSSRDIYKGSQWAFQPNLPDQAPHGMHHRFISSDSRIIAHKAWLGIGRSGAYNDLGTIGVCRDTGNLVNETTPAVFYIFSGQMPGAADVAVIGNMGPSPATYDIYRYQPFDQLEPSPNTCNVSIDLVSNAGQWLLAASNHRAGPGDPDNPDPYTDPANPNPHVYGDEYDQTTFNTRYRLYKVVVKSGGPVQMFGGRNIIDRYSGGAMLHPSAPQPGKQTGMEYWLHTYKPAHDSKGIAVECIETFCPRVAQEVQLRSNDDYSGANGALYSTTDVDQCIAFKAITVPDRGELRNWVITSEAEGDIIVQYININVGEKFYTAPFMRRGTYYEFFHPAVVFAGQPFCLTVLVVDTSGGTKIEYCGVTEFTSSDPTALIEGIPMAPPLFAHDWHSEYNPGCQTLPYDNGVHVFCNVVLTKLGLQTIIGADAADGSITGMGTIQVVGVNVRFFKEPRIGIAASGDEINFKICYSNYSTASARDFVITDKVPNGFTYVEGSRVDHLCGTTHEDKPTDWVVAYSTDDPAGLYTDLTAGDSPAGVKWLKWTIPTVGVNSTGCACFKVKVN